MEINDAAFVIVKGFIDAKTDKGRTTWGSFVAMASRREVPFISVCFSNKELPKNTQWKDLLALHSNMMKAQDRNPDDITTEVRLSEFFVRDAVLNTMVKNRNAKPAEQAVSRYCLDSLGIRAVTFIEYNEATSSDIAFINSQKKSHQPSDAAPTDAKPADQDQAPQEEEKKSDEVYVRCQPILDPLSGIAMNELHAGNIVYTKLLPDSVFYKLLARSTRSFDGVITAEVTGVLINELGTATISMKLADNVSGVMKLSGKVKVKTPQTGLAEQSSRRRDSAIRLSNLSPEAIVAFSVLLLVIAAAMIVFYLMDGEL